MQSRWKPEADGHGISLLRASPCPLLDLRHPWFSVYKGWKLAFRFVCAFLGSVKLLSKQGISGADKNCGLMLRASGGSNVFGLN